MESSRSETSDGATKAWIQRELARRAREEDLHPVLKRKLPSPAECETLLQPTEAFDDEYSKEERDIGKGRGETSGIIKDLLTGCCAGWGIRPTSEEFYEAMRAETPSRREQNIASVLINEATLDQILLAYWQQAFTWHQLARAMRRQGIFRAKLARFVNAHGAHQSNDPTGTGTQPVAEAPGRNQETGRAPRWQITPDTGRRNHTGREVEAPGEYGHRRTAT